MGLWGFWFVDFFVRLGLYLENSFNMFMLLCRFLVLTINHAAMRTAVPHLCIPLAFIERANGDEQES
jgi:hypothetical protein